MLATLDENTRKRRLERSLLDRFGRPKDITRAALFVTSEEAAFLIGHALHDEGGYLPAGPEHAGRSIEPRGVSRHHR